MKKNVKDRMIDTAIKSGVVLFLLCTFLMVALITPWKLKEYFFAGAGTTLRK
jgi:hypothetical protein